MREAVLTLTSGETVHLYEYQLLTESGFIYNVWAQSQYEAIKIAKGEVDKWEDRTDVVSRVA